MLRFTLITTSYACFVYQGAILKVYPSKFVPFLCNATLFMLKLERIYFLFSSFLMQCKISCVRA